MGNLLIRTTVISFFINITASIIVYIFTKSFILAGFLLLGLIVLSLIGYGIWHIYKYIRMCRFLGIKSINIRGRENWRNHCPYPILRSSFKVNI